MIDDDYKFKINEEYDELFCKSSKSSANEITKRKERDYHDK